ncbi:MAG: thymidine phosphorylase, partial [Boseongicola sp. SB0670_bin_30]|nr:thymidine phosphorylase [Boseongicola sp. SB0670_bin_30]
PVVDKHSTGGIGDCVSLLLAPALAAVGVANPMISGRGLGHTGGTLDKLEAIPGVSTEIGEARFRRIVEETGTAIVAASNRIAPADRRLYAVRDVSGTVESIDLIVASILSKKLAAGLGALVLDVKCGSGAFMPGMEEARALANSLVETANGAGCPTVALITDMNQPLAPAAGNALEVAEVMRALTGAGSARWVDLALALGSELLVLADVEEESDAARERLSETIRSGDAAARFDAMVAALGGPTDFSAGWRSCLPAAEVVREVAAPVAGQVSAIDGHAIGMAVVRLGGGRVRDGDCIDPSVGFSDILPLGTEVAMGDPLARLHAADDAAADAAETAFLAAVRIGVAGEANPLVMGRVG